MPQDHFTHSNRLTGIIDCVNTISKVNIVKTKSPKHYKTYLDTSTGCAFSSFLFVAFFSLTSLVKLFTFCKHAFKN